MQKPATASWGVRISDADFEKLKAGFEPQDMDDKWHFTATDLDKKGTVTIHIIRYWAQEEPSALIIKPRGCGDDSDCDDSVKIEAITWDQTMGGYDISEQQAKVDAIILCRAVLGCTIDALPDYSSYMLWNLPADANVRTI